MAHRLIPITQQKTGAACPAASKPVCANAVIAIEKRPKRLSRNLRSRKRRRSKQRQQRRKSAIWRAIILSMKISMRGPLNRSNRRSITLSRELYGGHPPSDDVRLPSGDHHGSAHRCDLGTAERNSGQRHRAWRTSHSFEPGYRKTDEPA